MLIYSINSLESFNECKNYWKPTLLEKCEEDIKVMLVGNKTDLFWEEEIDEYKGLEFAKENNYLFRTTSCLNLDSIVNAFETLIIETFNSIKK